MNPDIDLTEGLDFRKRSDYTPGNFSVDYQFGQSRVRIFPHWTEKCLFIPGKILRGLGVRRIFSSPTEEFPPLDRCECCGRPKPPWKDICSRCDGQIFTPEEYKYKGLPKNPEMISNPRDLHV